MHYWINWSKWWKLTHFLKLLSIHINSQEGISFWKLILRQRSLSLESQRILYYSNHEIIYTDDVWQYADTSSIKPNPRHIFIDLNPSSVVSKLGSPPHHVKIAPADGMVVPFLICFGKKTCLRFPSTWSRIQKYV